MVGLGITLEQICVQNLHFVFKGHRLLARPQVDLVYVVAHAEKVMIGKELLARIDVG